MASGTSTSSQPPGNVKTESTTTSPKTGINASESDVISMTDDSNQSENFRNDISSHGSTSSNAIDPKSMHIGKEPKETYHEDLTADSSCETKSLKEDYTGSTLVEKTRPTDVPSPDGELNHGMKSGIDLRDVVESYPFISVDSVVCVKKDSNQKNSVPQIEEASKSVSTAVLSPAVTSTVATETALAMSEADGHLMNDTKVSCDTKSVEAEEKQQLERILTQSTAEGKAKTSMSMDQEHIENDTKPILNWELGVSPEVSKAAPLQNSSEQQQSEIPLEEVSKSDFSVLNEAKVSFVEPKLVESFETGLQASEEDRVVLGEPSKTSVVEKTISPKSALKMNGTLEENTRYSENQLTNGPNLENVNGFVKSSHDFEDEDSSIALTTQPSSVLQDSDGLQLSAHDSVVQQKNMVNTERSSDMHTNLIDRKSICSEGTSSMTEKSHFNDSVKSENKVLPEPKEIGVLKPEENITPRNEVNLHENACELNSHKPTEKVMSERESQSNKIDELSDVAKNLGENAKETLNAGNGLSKIGESEGAKSCFEEEKRMAMEQENLTALEESKKLGVSDSKENNADKQGKIDLDTEKILQETEASSADEFGGKRSEAKIENGIKVSSKRQSAERVEIDETVEDINNAVDKLYHKTEDQKELPARETTVKSVDQSHKISDEKMPNDRNDVKLEKTEENNDFSNQLSQNKTDELETDLKSVCRTSAAKPTTCDVGVGLEPRLRRVAAGNGETEEVDGQQATAEIEISEDSVQPATEETNNELAEGLDSSEPTDDVQRAPSGTSSKRSLSKTPSSMGQSPSMPPNMNGQVGDNGKMGSATSRSSIPDAIHYEPPERKKSATSELSRIKTPLDDEKATEGKGTPPNNIEEENEEKDEPLKDEEERENSGKEKISKEEVTKSENICKADNEKSHESDDKDSGDAGKIKGDIETESVQNETIELSATEINNEETSNTKEQREEKGIKNDDAKDEKSISASEEEAMGSSETESHDETRERKEISDVENILDTIRESENAHVEDVAGVASDEKFTPTKELEETNVDGKVDDEKPTEKEAAKSEEKEEDESEKESSSDKGDTGDQVMEENRVQGEYPITTDNVDSRDEERESNTLEGDENEEKKDKEEGKEFGAENLVEESEEIAEKYSENISTINKETDEGKEEEEKADLEAEKKSDLDVEQESNAEAVNKSDTETDQKMDAGTEENANVETEEKTQEETGEKTELETEKEISADVEDEDNKEEEKETNEEVEIKTDVEVEEETDAKVEKKLDEEIERNTDSVTEEKTDKDSKEKSDLEPEDEEAEDKKQFDEENETEDAEEKESEEKQKTEEDENARDNNNETNEDFQLDKNEDYEEGKEKQDISKDDKIEKTEETPKSPVKRIKSPDKMGKRGSLPQLRLTPRGSGGWPPKGILIIGNLSPLEGVSPLSSPPKPSKTPSSPKKPHKSSSPKKKNGMLSPIKTPKTPGADGRKLPPIKAPVGLAPNPNLKNIKSKIGSFDNIKYKPGGGDKKVISKKLDWRSGAKIGSLDNATFKPGTGGVDSRKQGSKEKESHGKGDCKDDSKLLGIGQSGIAAGDEEEGAVAMAESIIKAEVPEALSAITAES